MIRSLLCATSASQILNQPPAKKPKLEDEIQQLKLPLSDVKIATCSINPMHMNTFDFFRYIQEEPEAFRFFYNNGTISSPLNCPNCSHNEFYRRVAESNKTFSVYIRCLNKKNCNFQRTIRDCSWLKFFNRTSYKALAATFHLFSIGMFGFQANIQLAGMLDKRTLYRVYFFLRKALYFDMESNPILFVGKEIKNKRECENPTGIFIDAFDVSNDLKDIVHEYKSGDFNDPPDENNDSYEDDMSEEEQRNLSEKLIDGSVFSPEGASFDETWIGNKPKYNRGKRCQKVVVFGIVSRDTGHCVMYIVPRRTRSILWKIIMRHIHISCPIYSDSFSTYLRLKDIGFNHKMVNHSEELVTKEGVHTNHIEGLWSIFKQQLTLMHGTKNLESLNMLLQEFCWRRNYGRDPLRCPAQIAELLKKHEVRLHDWWTRRNKHENVGKYGD